jgi:hypothetical protein
VQGLCAAHNQNVTPVKFSDWFAAISLAPQVNREIHLELFAIAKKILTVEDQPPVPLDNARSLGGNQDALRAMSETGIGGEIDVNQRGLLLDRYRFFVVLAWTKRELVLGSQLFRIDIDLGLTGGSFSSLPDSGWTASTTGQQRADVARLTNRVKKRCLSIDASSSFSGSL